MKLSLSVRVAERFEAKRAANMSLSALASLAVEHGYHALCMRASQLGTHTPREEVHQGVAQLSGLGLVVSMVTGDFPIPENSGDGPAALRDITAYLDLAQVLGANLLRIAMKKEEDIVWARRAADEAAERGMRLAHQCHTRSLFEQVEHTIEVLKKIDRPNFGVIYEPANLELCGESYADQTIERLSPYIFNVYLQNQLLRPAGASSLETWCRGEVRFDQIPLWQPGGIDFPAVMASLKRVGYSGYVTIHQASAKLGIEAAVAESARYLRTLTAFEG